METGKVKKWIPAEEGKKGNFGFIIPDAGGNDVFFHGTQLAESAKQGGVIIIKEGDKVEYELGTGAISGRTEAQNVSIVQ